MRVVRVCLGKISHGANSSGGVLNRIGFGNRAKVRCLRFRTIPSGFVTMNTTLDRLEFLRREIASLEKESLSELVSKRLEILSELKVLDGEIAGLQGGKVRRTRGAVPVRITVSFDSLVGMLQEAPAKEIDIRRAHLDLGTIKGYVLENPGVITFSRRGTWPKVRLV